MADETNENRRGLTMADESDEAGAAPPEAVVE